MVQVNSGLENTMENIKASYFPLRKTRCFSHFNYQCGGLLKTYRKHISLGAMGIEDFGHFILLTVRSG